MTPYEECMAAVEELDRLITDVALLSQTFRRLAGLLKAQEQAAAAEVPSGTV